VRSKGSNIAGLYPDTNVAKVNHKNADKMIKAYYLLLEDYTSRKLFHGCDRKIKGVI